MQHIIEWPGGEYLTRKEALRALGIKGALFDRLVAVGIIPPPDGDNDRTLCWHWSDLWAAAQLWPRLLRLLCPEEAAGPAARKRTTPKNHPPEPPASPD